KGILAGGWRGYGIGRGCPSGTCGSGSVCHGKTGEDGTGRAGGSGMPGEGQKPQPGSFGKAAGGGKVPEGESRNAGGTFRGTGLWRRNYGSRVYGKMAGASWHFRDTSYLGGTFHKYLGKSCVFHENSEIPGGEKGMAGGDCHQPFPYVPQS